MSEWRVGHQGRDQMYYEERIGSTWQRLEIQGEMLMGVAHHVIYFASPAAWDRYPEWARGRREEIIARIKSEFRPPEYEYQGDGASISPSAPAPAAPESHARPAMRQPIQGMRALLIAIFLMLVVGGGMSWLVATGLNRGVTTLPHKWSSVRRPVVRADEPAMYWVSLTVYATIGLGTLTLAVWGMRERRRLLTGKS
jgi:hypothetical protein